MSFLFVSIAMFAGFILGGCQTGDPIVKRSQMLMGTLVFVTAVGPNEETAHDAVSAGFDEIQRLENLMSTWKQDSELSRVNALAGQQPVPVSPDTFKVVQRSLDMANLTGGAFNVTVGPAVAAWDVSREGRIPLDQELADLQPLTDLSQLSLNEEASTVFLARKGMQIDIGGIGKGFAADLAAQTMKSQGAVAGVVALSGDIKTFGRMPEGHKFVFGIQHPRKDQGQVLATIELENEAVSTAGDYQRYFMKNGIRYHHILNPETLRPARLCQSVTVIASEGTVADGLDTGIFVMGPEKGMALIESLPDVEGVIVDRDGKIHVSSGLKDRLQLRSSVNVWLSPPTQPVGVLPW